MKLQFAGVGGAFAGMNQWQSNMVVKDGDRCLLIDCGTDIRHSIREIGLSYRDIDAVYITHLHADHCGGLEWFGFISYFDPDKPKPKLFIYEGLVSLLWQTLYAGMSILHNKEMALKDFFDVRPIPDFGSFEYGSAKFTIHPTPHITIAGQHGVKHTHAMFVYGLSIQTNIITHITGDTKEVISENLHKKSDVIFHDCEVGGYNSNVHAPYEQLLKLPLEVRNKIWLYHYNPTELDPVEDGFAGFVTKGQEFDI